MNRYPKSKTAAEAVLREEHGHIPSVVLRLAGVYDTQTMVPTMAQQMARIYERDLQSHLYAGSLLVGQSALHRDDMLAALRLAVDRREQLPGGTEILIGEADAIGCHAMTDKTHRHSARSAARRSSAGSVQPPIDPP
jgi:nucleoside-diphosphate-sugar epimerase